MMTRGHVARRLGKSIATVRRMEGVELHPVKDANGVNRFDPEEVEGIALLAREHLRPVTGHRIGTIGQPCYEQRSDPDRAVGRDFIDTYRVELERLRQAQREIDQERNELRRLKEELLAKDRKRQKEADDLGRLVLDALRN